MRRVSIAGGFAAFFTFGCSTSQAIPEPGKSDVVSPKPSPKDAAPTKDAGQPVQCHGPGYAGTPSKQDFHHLAAIVVDDAGKPIPSIMAQACGTDICLFGDTKDDGSIDIRQSVPMKKPAFKYGGGEQYVRFARALTDSSIDVDLGPQMTFAFDAPEMGTPLEPGKSATSRGITVTLSPSALDVVPDAIDFYTPALKKFRAVEVPIDKAPAAVDASLKFGMVVALTPAATVLCPAASLELPNSPGWPAGSRVELFLHGVDVSEEWAPYGGWAKVSTGTVSDDGATIATDPDGGIPALSVVGIRLQN